ncbi:hypothetical protein LJB88_04795 [Erysipelotrichaceae bacterium OttesenSCG-928-M19]|nr:hypothetical protein [Erysipelotrichaceae bacterium OttesenSCG-928-M19]
MKKIKLNKKGIVGIVIALFLIIGFGAYKYVAAENLKKEIATVKQELNTKYDEETTKYLKDNKLITADDIAFLEKKAIDVKLEENTNEVLKILNDDKIKLDTLDSKLIKSLTKKVTTKKASVLKTLKDLKASTKTEKNTKANLVKKISDLVVAKDVPGLVKNLKALELNLKDVNALKKSINKRIETTTRQYTNSNNYSSGNNSSGTTGGAGKTPKAYVPPKKGNGKCFGNCDPDIVNGPINSPDSIK